MGLLFFYLIISLLFSFLCSLLEAALLSITPSHVGITAQENPTLGKHLQEFKDNIDRPLAAILTVNTFAHTIGAAGVGAQAQIIWGEEYLSLVSAILTIIILILSEIIPKTLGANYWRQLTPFTVATLRIMIYSPLYPLIILSQFITKRLKREKDKSVLSRADFTAMAEIGIKEGIFKRGESQILRNVLRFNQILVRHVMTPRTVVYGAQEDMSIVDFFKQAKTLRFSRIPLYQNNLDDINGYVLKDEVLAKLIDNQGNQPLKSIKRDIEVVTEYMPIPELFSRLLKDQNHIALVVDEYGGTAGIVTMEDIIETLLGMEIMDEMDNVEDMQKWARENWAKRAKSIGLKTE
ncbi:CNNM domain-containing protein [Pontibacter ramchanderi]|uniref:CBS domain containing-hemolysin-like protein n=1 Tax=Pontibacter ramchanderi TaxID=1179743 RepID=A0A2N3U7X8_9BACT|nr:CNNM domain-containing protein [Pontibacter ramchanderi]PKV62853.1 CBS domain containing-hemolysin-like protein [Pontibacter ramchanderi]